MGVDVAEVNKCNQSSLDYIHHPISMQDINIAYFSGKTVKLCVRCWTGQLPWMSSSSYERCLWNGGFYLLMSRWNLTQTHGFYETRGKMTRNLGQLSSQQQFWMGFSWRIASIFKSHYFNPLSKVALHPVLVHWIIIFTSRSHAQATSASNRWLKEKVDEV